MIYLQPGVNAETGNNVGIALGGGGPLGMVYEIGVLNAVADVFEGIDLTDMHSYVGVSAGAYNAAYLASGIKPDRTRRILVESSSKRFQISPASLIRLSVHDVFKVWKVVPRFYRDFFTTVVQHPKDFNFLDILTRALRALPPALFESDFAEEITRNMLTRVGITDDFRELDKELYIVATQLETGKVVRFGSEGYDHVPISRALQASQAAPGMFSPVEIDGELYIDGGLKKAFHASTLFDAGADFIICINPLVPYDKREVDTSDGHKPRSLMELGFGAVTSQGLLQLSHTRLRLGLEQYKTQYPERELILFEPSSGDEKIFFANIWSFKNRVEICQHVYECTLQDIADKEDELTPLLSRHGISIRQDVIKPFRSANPVKQTTGKRGKKAVRSKKKHAA